MTTINVDWKKNQSEMTTNNCEKEPIRNYYNIKEKKVKSNATLNNNEKRADQSRKNIFR